MDAVDAAAAKTIISTNTSFGDIIICIVYVCVFYKFHVYSSLAMLILLCCIALGNFVSCITMSIKFCIHI